MTDLTWIELNKMGVLLPQANKDIFSEVRTEKNESERWLGELLSVEKRLEGEYMSSGSETKREKFEQYKLAKALRQKVEIYKSACVARYWRLKQQGWIGTDDEL